MASSHLGFGQSKEFLDLIKSIGEARSKAEEDRIVRSEIDILKRRIIEPDVPKRKMKEYIIRSVYVEMLGHDASFGYIHAVKMTHDDNLLLKRTGYLAVTLFLNEDHGLVILIVNTIQKNLKSDNFLVVCAALNAVCRLTNEETIPAVLPQVVELLAHQKEAVRKKAVMVLHRFHQRAPSSVSHLLTNFRKIKLLKILSLLGSSDKLSSEQMYTIVGEIVRKCDQLTNIGNAVMYECVCCISSIYPSSKLLEAAAGAISRFLKSDTHNLKYMGIDALGRLIKISPEVAEQHQLAIIDCLEDPDDTLKRKTFELLYKITKSSNVEVIVDRMIDYMRNINDNHYKTEIGSRCVELAEQFAPSNQWFIKIMNYVFEYAGDLVNVKVAQNLMRLIAEGFGEDAEAADSQLRLSAVESYLRIVREPKLPSLFLQVICWVLGEYGTADGKYSASYINGKLYDVTESCSSDDTVKGYAITAIMKICAFELAAGKRVDLLPECQSLIEVFSASSSTDLQQRAYEVQTLFSLENKAIASIMPFDASCEDTKVDNDLSFLSSYVQQALKNGAEPYISENERSGTPSISNAKLPRTGEGSSHAIRLEACELAKAPTPEKTPQVSHISSMDLVLATDHSYTMEARQAPAAQPVTLDGGPNNIRLRLDGVQKKWGRPNYPSSSPSASSSSTPKAYNGASYHEQANNFVSKTRDDSRKQQVEGTQEKQKLAASLFGGTSRTEKRSSSSHKHMKPSRHHHADKLNVTKKVATVKTAPAPSPYLLDLGEPENVLATHSADPLVDLLKQPEGLLETLTAVPSSSSKGAYILGPYCDVPVSSWEDDDTLIYQLELPPSFQLG